MHDLLLQGIAGESLLVHCTLADEIKIKGKSSCYITEVFFTFCLYHCSISVFTHLSTSGKMVINHPEKPV